MRLLLFGRNGQVGSALAPLLAELGDLTATGRAEADLGRPEMLAPLIEAARPDVIVNAAAYTAVDAAEDDSALAHRVNAESVGVIGAAAEDIGALVIHYSTDFVFDGRSAAPYREDVAPNPLSVYGASKLAGERALAASGARHVILRTSWNYAPIGRNFPLTILRLARERETLNVVADEIGAATPVDLIADATLDLIAQTRDDPGKAGLFHLSASGAASRCELARFIVSEARASGARLLLSPDAILPVAASDLALKVARPENSRFDTTLFRSTFGMQLPPWQDGIRRLIRTLAEGGRL